MGRKKKKCPKCGNMGYLVYSDGTCPKCQTTQRVPNYKPLYDIIFR